MKNSQVSLPNISLLKNKYITLRPVNSGDYKQLFEWYSDVTNLHMWWADRQIMSFDEFVDDFQRRLGRMIQTIFLVQTCDKENNYQLVGLVYNYNSNFIDQYTYLCIYLSPKYTARGIGLQAGLLFVDYLFVYFNFRKIYGEIFGYNKLSLKSALHAGFVEEGCLRNHRWFYGSYWDLYILSLNYEQFLKIKNKFNKYMHL